jgi:hypothetical protein
MEEHAPTVNLVSLLIKTKIMKFSRNILILIIVTLNFTVMGQTNLLYGSWQSTNGTITSFTDKAMIIGNFSYRYTINQNNIKLFDGNGNSMSYKFQVDGNTLYLVEQGAGTYMLTKVNAQQPTKRGNAQQGNVNASAGRLYGTFCSYSSSGYSGSSSYSTTQRVSFDGRGHYSYGSESSYSGGGDGYSGGSGGYSGTYTINGNQSVVLTATDGSKYQVQIFFVQDSGEITELKYDGTVYAKSLCN